MSKSISVLMTTFNRIETTIKCLDALFKADLPENYTLNVIISDSNSPDKTFEILKKKFPSIIIQNVGNNIYWNQGMIQSWNEAKKSDPDFYLWLNDDTFLNRDALRNIIKDYFLVSKDSIIVGATHFNYVCSYGGRFSKLDERSLAPNGKPNKIKYMNGNFVLISRGVFNKIGMLDNRYSHSLGDIDYGLKANMYDIDLYITSKFVGECKINEKIDFTLYGIKDRLKLIKSPKGFPPKEYLYFNLKYYGIIKAVIFMCAISFIIFMPGIYKKITNK